MREEAKREAIDLARPSAASFNGIPTCAGIQTMMTLAPRRRRAAMALRARRATVHPGKLLMGWLVLVAVTANWQSDRMITGWLWAVLGRE